MRGIKVRQILQVPRSASGPFHATEVGQGRYPDSNTKGFPAYGLGCQLRERVVLVHAGDPLHDVEATDPGVQQEVPTTSQMLRIGRIQGEFVAAQVLFADLPCTDIGKHAGQTSEVVPVRIRTDIQVLSGTDHPMSDDREAADDDVLDVRVVKATQPLFYVKRRCHPGVR